jgi:hypothetical protein
MHQITPVSVVTDSSGRVMLDSDNQPVIILDPDQSEIAESFAVYGCQACGLSLPEAVENPQCEGDPDDE